MPTTQDPPPQKQVQRAEGKGCGLSFAVVHILSELCLGFNNLQRLPSPAFVFLLTCPCRKHSSTRMLLHLFSADSDQPLVPGFLLSQPLVVTLGFINPINVLLL